MATWHTPTTAAAAWEDAPDQAELGELLEISKTAVLAYVHPKTEGESGVIPPAWRRVQLEHARNVYKSGYTVSTAEYAFDEVDGYSAPSRYRDLAANLRELLRPRSVFGGPVG